MTTEEAQSLIGRTGRIVIPPGASSGGGIRLEWPPREVRVVGYEVDPSDPSFVQCLLADPIPHFHAIRDNREIPYGKLRPGWFIPTPQGPQEAP